MPRSPRDGEARVRRPGASDLAIALLLLAAAFDAALPTASAETSGTTVVSIEWEHEEGPRSMTLSLEMPVSDRHIDGYRSYSISERVMYGRLITPDDPYVQIVAMKVAALADRHGFSDLGVALSLVQSVPYVTDNESAGTPEYPRFPLETLVDGAGDCEDKSVLYASMVIALGDDAVLFLVLNDNVSHMATGVAAPGLFGSYVSHNGSDYYYAETTSAGGRIGQLPDEIDLADIEILDPATPYSPFRDAADGGEERFDPFAMPARLFLVAFLLIGLIAGVAASHRPDRDRADRKAMEMPPVGMAGPLTYGDLRTGDRPAPPRDEGPVPTRPMRPERPGSEWREPTGGHPRGRTRAPPHEWADDGYVPTSIEEFRGRRPAPEGRHPPEDPDVFGRASRPPPRDPD
ncbi:MAG: hypothetical protein L0Z54_04670 [Thermoplasmata archaeon]|nr:hypothetical protein [Thermoplasmata archaeon]